VCWSITVRCEGYSGCLPGYCERGVGAPAGIVNVILEVNDDGRIFDCGRGRS